MSEITIFVLIFVGLLIVLFIKWVFFSENERAIERLAVECLGRQALKRGGAMSGEALTFPYKAVQIEVAHKSHPDDLTQSYSFATFRAEGFEDKRLGIFYRKESLLRPLLTGTRLEVAEDERFDAAYIVSGNDLVFANSVLTREVRDKLLEFEDSHLTVRLGRPAGSTAFNRESGWLSVIALANYGVADMDYDSVIETAFVFYERLAALRSSH